MRSTQFLFSPTTTTTTLLIDSKTHREYVEPLLILCWCLIGFIEFFREIPEQFFGQTWRYMHSCHQHLHCESHYAQHNDQTEQPQSRRTLHCRLTIGWNNFLSINQYRPIFRTKKFLSDQHNTIVVKCKAKTKFTSDNNQKI